MAFELNTGSEFATSNRTDRVWKSLFSKVYESKDTVTDLDSHSTNTEDETGSCGTLHRATIDIRHVNLKKLPFAPDNNEKFNSKIVAVGKHLCGAATDLTLTSLLNILRKDPENNDCGVRATGVAIILCCHGLMQWGDYPMEAKKWLHDTCGAGEKEFHWMVRLSSWAVDGGRMAHESDKDLHEQEQDATKEVSTGPTSPVNVNLEHEEVFVLEIVKNNLHFKINRRLRDVDGEHS
eukprot:m.256300 g.256300  ORF g.256300 m.256300 type:complete len:236 (-) comp16186_c0_seq19:3765-4472(-)